MLMNSLEFTLMDNPVKGVVHEFIEMNHIRRLSQLPKDKKVLEIGCGNGYGTKLINKHFHPNHITAIDLDEKMIAIAKKKYAAPNVNFETADVTRLPYKNNSFDAIFDFAIIHHVPNWRDALKELHRVLKPGGELLIEDLSIETFETPFGRILRRVLAHPYKEMYRREKFVKQLEKAGFSIIKQEQHFPLATVQFFNVIAQKH